MSINTLRRKYVAVGDTFDDLVQDAETLYAEKHDGWILQSLHCLDIEAGVTQVFRGTFEAEYRRNTWDDEEA